MGKWSFLDQKHGLTRFKKGHFSSFWTSCFYSLERRFFVLEYRKRHFPGLYYLNNKVGKMAIFRPKPWVNPLWKNGHFSTFWISCFCSQERRFLVLEYCKRHSAGLYYLRKNLEKWQFLDQNQGLTPLEKSQFFDSKTSCFYSLKRCFFVLEYRKRHFPCLYCLKQKSWKNGHFWIKSMG